MSQYLYGGHAHANGIRQHYLRYGGAGEGRDQRPAVIIVPGITSPAVTWGFVGEQFGRHFDTYIQDVRGRGLSEAAEGMDYSLDAQADDLIALAQALGLERYIVVGHSMGARIGLRAARKNSRGLERLVMVDPPVSGPGRRAYPSKLPWYVDSMAMARKGCTAEDMRAFCPTWTEEQLQLRAQWLHTCHEPAILASFEGFHTDDVHADFPRIQVPVMLMVAERGDVIRAEDIAEIQSLIPGVTVARVANAGHMIPWDNEAGFYAAFGDFLGVRIA